MYTVISTGRRRSVRRRATAHLARALVLLALPLAAGRSAGAQQRPDSAGRPRTRADSVRADSVARADSIATVRELERMQAPGAGGATPATAPGASAQPPAAGGPSNPRLMPDISAIGEVIGDLTRDTVSQEGGRRVDVREVELAISSAVDPYFRADFILGLSDLEGIAIEEAYITSTALPYGLQARLGRFHMPIGKQNTTHRGELQTIEYPYVIQRFLGAEASKGTGLSVSRIFAPLGFYQELQVTFVDRFFEGDEDGLRAERPANERLSGLGYSARFRNYADLSESTNLELSASAATGRRAQPLACLEAASGCGPSDVSAANARESLVGLDLTFRWRPLQQALYKSFIVQAEVMRQVNERRPTLPAIARASGAAYAGPTRDFSGAYVFSRYQIGQRRYLGARYDWVQDPLADGARFQAVSGYVQFFPSEFSKFVVAYERTMPAGPARRLDRILLQSTFAVGPHRPHPF